jgi:hypothetical protein
MSLPTDSPFNAEGWHRLTRSTNHENNVVAVLNHLYDKSKSLDKVKHYRTDHVRDAFWLKRNMPEFLSPEHAAISAPEPHMPGEHEYLIGWTFYYGVRLTGTTIGTSEDVWFGHDDQVWRVTFHAGRWTDEFRIEMVSVREDLSELEADAATHKEWRCDCCGEWTPANVPCAHGTTFEMYPTLKPSTR